MARLLVAVFILILVDISLCQSTYGSVLGTVHGLLGPYGVPGQNYRGHKYIDAQKKVYEFKREMANLRVEYGSNPNYWTVDMQTAMLELEAEIRKTELEGGIFPTRMVSSQTQLPPPFRSSASTRMHSPKYIDALKKVTSFNNKIQNLKMEYGPNIGYWTKDVRMKMLEFDAEIRKIQLEAGIVPSPIVSYKPSIKPPARTPMNPPVSAPLNSPAAMISQVPAPMKSPAPVKSPVPAAVSAPITSPVSTHINSHTTTSSTTTSNLTAEELQLFRLFRQYVATNTLTIQ